MIRITFILIFLLASGFSTGCVNNSLSESERWNKHASNTEIIRDDFGVPHIYGKTDADAVFGLLYAQCEDDFNRVEQNYIWATGRLAEIEGENAIYSDLRAKLFMTQKEAEIKYQNSPQWLKDLCLAFADGINFYLAKHPEVKPRLLTRFEPWMPMYFSEGSIGGDIEKVSTRKMGELYGRPDASMIPKIMTGSILHKDNEPRGSNGFAVSGKLTESGNAMLLINPHTSFFFRGEVHVQSEQGLNAYGAVTWGQFFVYQGFNEKTGWMHTTSDVDIIDEFEETIVRNKNGINYKYGNELRPLDSFEVVVKYKDVNNLRSKKFMAYRTHHGPVTRASGNKWVSTAMMWDPVKALQQSFLRTKNSNQKEFDKMMDIRTNSSNNTVYADADGNIAYYHGNFIPKRDTNFDYKKPVDGSNPKTDWKGLHDLKDNIFLLNPANGWIQNCNSTPFTSAGASSPKPENYPGYMSYSPENYRGVHAISLLSKAKNLTIDKMIELAYDPYLPGAEELIRGLIQAYDSLQVNNEDMKTAIDLLKNWDYKVSSESKAMTISQFYLNTYINSGKIPGGIHIMEKVNYMSSKSPAKERLEIFANSLADLKRDFGSVETAWGEFNRYQRINGDINQNFNDALPSIPIGMASGEWGALASFGTRKGSGTKRQYGVAGNSFVAVVEFGEKVQAKTMLAGGQSADPKSVHFDDQMQRYADRKFKTVAFYREDVLKRAESRYHPGDKP
ncbi:MAG: acylase [Sphingobacteriales bacterium 17-39-43]|uniref:acylase n=1 Tax=Daejeonella sp. TaxID=2805397 RepID=UPI000BD466DC|nr:acylase [Daejeonella sp.]OYY02520.1 MAG: acylase [Sphingobacteriia bacterium 35-40-5]OYZ33276.1 MAG: acylase [Sphingobacteriales bacterium 16-39-50]OZA26685.1 MAG: acylase [Sphingobacteriales bacterium 17-39-43]HQT22289.1 acylase [Daejeonella sp.]HQT56870.1 acylase [Daejeonella sp.]